MIPTFNEEENVLAIYEAVRDVLIQDCPNYDYEILIIDNKSTDRTRELIRSICENDKKVKAIFALPYSFHFLLFSIRSPHLL